MLEVRNLTKIYKTKKVEDVRALDNVSISFNDTGMVFLLGKSGSGKSTLLNVMGGLDKFDSGEIIIKGKSSKTFSERDFDSYRNTFLGFIFQEYNILPEFTVQKNIALALELQGKKADKESVENLLNQVDLKGYAKRKPNQLSGGQKQRIAIARALIKNPEIIMADEPTGALDSNTGKQVFDTLKKLSQTKLVIVVSHDREFAEIYADRIIEMKDGKVISDVTKRQKPPKELSRGFKIVGKNMIHIEKNHKFNALEAKYLNDIVKSSETDIIISADSKINKDIKKIAKIDDNGNSEYFDETVKSDIKEEKYFGDNLKLIKSKLKFKDSFKMGASGLKTKKVRLVITILLSAIALAMFGLADTMASFNPAKSNYESLKSLGVETVSIGKVHVEDDDGYTYRQEATITEKDLVDLQNKFTNYTFIGKNTINFSLDNYCYDSNKYYYYYEQSVAGAYEMDEAKAKLYGISLYPNPSTGKFPTESNEVAITKYHFDMLKDLSYRDRDNGQKVTIQSVNDILNKTIAIENNDFKIVGVLDTNLDTSKYEMLKNNPTDYSAYMLQEEFKTLLNYGFHNSLFFNQGVVEQLNINRVVSGQYNNVYFGEDYLTNGYYDNFSANGQLHINNGNAILIDDNYTMKSNDILVGSDILTTYFSNFNFNPTYTYDVTDRVYYISYNGNKYYSIDEFKTQFVTDLKNQFKDSNITANLYNYRTEQTEKLNVVGVYLGILNFDSIEEAYKNQYRFSYQNQAIYFKDYLTVPESIQYLFGNYKSLQVKLLNDKSSDFELVKYLSNYQSKADALIIKSQISGILENFVSTIEIMAQVFLYIGIGFAVFSALLLMNFIAISISYKKKEIGILRALGARGSDVYGIFFNESLIITFFNYVIAIILTVASIIAINFYMKNELGFYLTLLTFGIRQLILLALVSFLVAVISSFLPTNRISRMKPIDAIQDRK